MTSLSGKWFGGRADDLVLFAEMRTGSNFPEQPQQIPSVSWRGVQPAVRLPQDQVFLGYSRAERDVSADPGHREKSDGIGGFSSFDHHPAVIDLVWMIRAAKNHLTRNPAESYVMAYRWATINGFSRILGTASAKGGVQSG